MIKVNHGNIEISGSSAEIINDLADAIKGIKCALKNGGGTGVPCRNHDSRCRSLFQHDQR